MPVLRLSDAHSSRHVRAVPGVLWQDDGQRDHDANVVRTQARAHFLRFGASPALDVDFVRPPYIDEHLVSR